MNKINQQFNYYKHFLHNDLWKIDISELGWLKKTFYKALKVLVIASKHFKDDKLQVRASGLTYLTLLSIVPVLAMAFGIAKGFGMANELERQILEKFEGHEEVVAASLEFALNLLDHTRGGLIAGIGLLFLFYTVMKLLGSIEGTFNDIWYINKARSPARKLTDYLTIIMLGPILLVLSNSLTIAVTQKIAELTETVQFIGLFKGVIFPLLRLLPYVVVWLLFSLLYLIIPNTHVKLKSAIVAGILAGSAFQLTQWGLLYFGVGVARMNAIYGTFAALPLFLIWVQLSWLIVLVGAEMAYAIQNSNNHNFSEDGVNYSIESKRKLSLSICLLIVRNFKDGKEALTFIDIHEKFDVSDELLQEVLKSMVSARILSITKSEDNITAYQPAQDTDRLDVATVVFALEQNGSGLPDSIDSELLKTADDIMKESKLLVEQSGENKLLKEI